jgi:hypothetical protein
MADNPKHVNNGMDTTVNPIVIDDSFRSKPVKKYDYRCRITGENDCDGKCDSDVLACRCGYECEDCKCTTCNQAEANSSRSERGMIEQYVTVPDVEDTADQDGYNEILDYLKGAIGSKYRGKEVRITVRAVKHPSTKGGAR